MKEAAADGLALRELLIGLALGAALMAAVLAVAWALLRRNAPAATTSGTAVSEAPQVRTYASQGAPVHPTPPPPAGPPLAGPPLAGPPPAGRPPAGRTPTSTPRSGGPSDALERRALVDGLADLALRLPAGLDREAVDVLARAGVTRRGADGLRFDPAWQDALGSEPTADPALEGTVARTVRDFFDDRGRPASRPQVVVLVRDPAAPPPDDRGPGDRTGAPT